MSNKAKKSFGQHFLNNETIAQNISNALNYKDNYSNVLEVGPGKGMLTKFLLQQPFELKAVEADKDMIPVLQNNFPELFNNILFADFLKVDLSQVFDGHTFGLIGNFPYNISSQIVFKMLEYKHYIPEMVGMFQKEMAERITSAPGSKAYGVISVLTQAFYSGQYLFTVENGNFSPPPKVKSGVIRLKRERVAIEGCDEQLLRKVVKTTFNQRRKMLRNSLKAVINDEDFLKDAFFDQRPEKLSVQDFIELTGKIESLLNVEQK